jgi:hypothetical protein
MSKPWIKSRPTFDCAAIVHGWNSLDATGLFVDAVQPVAAFHGICQM